MNAQTESHTRLHGTWLLIARLEWVVGFITLTLMYALGFLAVREAFSTVCKEELCTLRQQIRYTEAGDQVMSWPGPPIGYADRLHQDQVEALERFGLTLDQYGWLATLQVGLPVLIFLLIAAGLFRWKSDDWMVLFASIMVATIPIGNGPLLFMLVVRQPAWEWVYDSVSVVALSCFLIFPLIFPTGRFVPRWTRWMALFEIAGAVVIIFFPNSILEGPHTKNVVVIYVALSFVTGVYSQLYRYFRVASPVERQQLKWVVVGLAGFISITLLVLLPLNTLLVYRATGMDPARALALSVIPDTIFQVILPFIPVSIAISVLRYRLWDIDVIISRTLVYGALTASVVGMYVLMVGGLSMIMQTQNNLPGNIFTILVITFLFRPLRQWLQGIADRYVPVPQSALPVEQHEHKIVTPEADPSLRDYRLFIAPDIPGPKHEIEESPLEHKLPLHRHWLAWLLFDLTCVFSAIGCVFLALSWTTPLQDIWGFRGEAAVLALAFSNIGLLLARRHPQNPIGWLLLAAGLVSAIVEFGMEYAAYALLTKPGALPYGTLAAWIASWVWVAAIGLLIYSFLLFPTGHLPSERWRPVAWLIVGGFALTICSFMIRPGPLRFASYLDNPFAVQAVYRALSPLEFANAGAILLIGFSVILRLRRAQGIERQQLKWFAYTATLMTIIGMSYSLADAAGIGTDPTFYQYLTVAIWIAIAVTIAFAIVRYRLWDIDLIINRTLVYGALTVSVVSLYILMVGGLSIVLQTQNNLPGIVITILVIAFLFQPLRQRLQGIADRFAPVPQSTLFLEQHEHETAIPKSAASQANSETPSQRRMNVKKRSLLAWGLFGLTLCGSAFGFGQWLLTGQAHGDWAKVVQALLWSLLPVVFAFISGLIISRQPRNMIGWLLIIIPLLFMLDSLISLEISSVTTAPDSPSLALFLAVWFGSIEWVFMILPPFLIVFLFPTGGPPSPRWRWVVPYVIALVVFFVTVTTFAPVLPPNRALFSMDWSLVNPIGFIPPDVVEIIFSIWLYLALVLLAVLCVASLYVRYRRTGTVEKKQIQWLLYASGLFALVWLTLALTQSKVLLNFVFPFLLMNIPMSIGIVILWYRLWDIDLIINRTLVYGALTAGIVITYVLLVGLFGTWLNTNVTLAAILVTVALTALFIQPLRARLQRSINRVTFGGRDMPNLKQESEESLPDVEMSLRPRWFEVANSVWVVCAMLAAIILIGTVPIYYSHIAHPNLSNPYNVGQSNIPFQVLVGVSDLVSGFLSFALAGLLFWRKPNDRMALFISFFLLFTSVAWNHSLNYFLTAYFGASSTDLLWSELSTPAAILLFCIFPDGRFVPRWTHWLFLFSIMQTFSFLAIPEWRFILGVVGAPPFILATYAQVYRYRRVSSEAEREQTKWFVFGLFVSLVLWIIANLIYKKPSPPLLNVTPIFLAIAILRYRLWDIDLIINRTLVYGALTAGIVALYILLVGALSIVSQTTGNLLISLLATGLIAFLFQPLRQRLQRGVNHLLYGERDEPYVVLSQLGQHLETALAPTALLPTIAETIGRTLKLPFVEIRLNDDEVQSVSIGEPQKTIAAFPLTYQSETVGELHVAPRKGEALSSADQNLLKDLARQTGIAIHAAQVTVDLQRSRERLVLAREEERRRLRRDLHDDLGPTLASLGLTASTAADLIETNPTSAKKLVKELQNEIRATVGNIRRLVYDLRPPTLDELGLLAAVRERAAQYSNAPDGFHVTVDTPAELPALPAAVEVATYRIVQEALENVSKHSQAQQCTILFVNHHGLEIEITDNGIGLPSNITPGIGLRSMRERAEELGGSFMIERCLSGGTRILARLPIGEFDGSIAHPDRG